MGIRKNSGDYVYVCIEEGVGEGCRPCAAYRGVLQYSMRRGTHRGYECHSAGSGMLSAGVCPMSSHDSRYIIMRLCSPRAFILGW